MSELREFVRKMLDDGTKADQIMLEMITCVYDSLSCPDCQSEVGINRTTKDLDIFYYQATVSHDETCPALKDMTCQCDDEDDDPSED